ncbi:MAG TPA: NAD-binding protein [Miltoncostaeaceae bacterium]|nr:NAD-binding protein [Miltoncostaeaceae bacterium]
MTALVSLPVPARGPLFGLSRRLGLAGALIAFQTAVAYIGRGGYRDSAGGDVSLLDALYYSTVSITTTGYGDITPVTSEARLATILLVTPARVLFLALLVGTALELLAERSREDIRRRRWRRRMEDHTIVCGYGTKGRSAIRVLRDQGVPASRIVVIDAHAGPVARANAAGYAAIQGNAASTEVLREAAVDRARAVIVAPDRDDTAVLVTLTVHEMNHAVTVVAAAREAENVHLLRQSGADSVITSSDAAGRLLGLATRTPRVVEVLEDLLTVGIGFDIRERPAGEEELGQPPRLGPGEMLLAVARRGEMLRAGDPAVQRLQPGDQILTLGHATELGPVDGRPAG